MDLLLSKFNFILDFAEFENQPEKKIKNSEFQIISITLFASKLCLN